MPRGRYRTASSEPLKAGYLGLQNEALVKGNTLPIWKLGASDVRNCKPGPLLLAKGG
jgi:hypothetical protein